VPEVLHAYTFDRKAKQGEGDDLGTWMRELPPQTVGCLYTQLSELKKLKEWAPGMGHGRSLLIWGALGSGKSLWAALKVRQLLEAAQVKMASAPLPTDTLQRWLGDPCADDRALAKHDGADALQRDRAYSAGRRWSTWWTTLADLTDDIRERQRSFHLESIRDPLHKATTVSLLVLDDLGAEWDPATYTDNNGFWDLDAFRRDVRRARTDRELGRLRTTARQVINARYDAGTPLILTSNLPPEVLLDPDTCPYGSRVGSRLGSMVGSHVVQLGGVSWRQPPPPTPTPRRRVRR
jgi:DNA replication protein DnaC